MYEDLAGNFSQLGTDGNGNARNDLYCLLISETEPNNGHYAKKAFFFIVFFLFEMNLKMFSNLKNRFENPKSFFNSKNLF